LNLEIGLPVGKLKDQIHAVLDGREPQTVELEALNRIGKTIKVQATCSPLIGQEKDVAGIVLW
jgi:hypothetical protein